MSFELFARWYRGGGVAVEQNWHSADAAAHIFNGAFGSLLSIGAVAALEVTTAYFWSYDRATGTSTMALIYCPRPPGAVKRP